MLSIDIGRSWWSQWGVMVVSHCHSSWRLLSDAFLSDKLMTSLILAKIVLVLWNLHSGYLKKKIGEFALQCHGCVYYWDISSGESQLLVWQSQSSKCGCLNVSILRWDNVSDWLMSSPLFCLWHKLSYLTVLESWVLQSSRILWWLWETHDSLRFQTGFWIGKRTTKMVVTPRLCQMPLTWSSGMIWNA